MSSKGGFVEVAGVELASFVARHQNCAVFIKDPYDPCFDQLMECLTEDREGKQPNCAVVWMSKSAAPRYIGHFRVSGDYNIIIYFDGQPVRKLIGIPPAECLMSAVADALSVVKPSPPPER
jgi:hypothetical protein